MVSSIQASAKLSNGVEMPWLGLGVWKVKVKEEVERAVHAAVAAGYRSIDTAKVYGNEADVGEAIRTCGVSRDKLFVTTKIWNEDQGYDRTLAAFEGSRKRLGLDVIDLLLIHWPGKDRYVDTWRALEKLYEEGSVRAIGVSNFQVRHLEALAAAGRMTPMVNQVEFHPLLTQKELLSYCRANGIQLEAWSPLMQGHLDHPALADIAAAHGKTPAQIVLRWDLQHGVVTIPKSVTPSRIAENAGIFDFSLTDEEVARLDALNENRRFGPNPDEMLF
ncbi:aldo/keto reductase [Cohnella zeiphila]|uniref:Aldo/keto reductase n=1 Tax=Cohnella zeiphila TaxID=2761120 RepID=A0A7X0SKJ8_9BACL|nr:aldo/keto reductase [Cohnella zeiphila]MBB6731641.1 aldo/keto reductase [Cohnella zeiphila]